MIWRGPGKIENEFIFSSRLPLQFFSLGKAFLNFFPGGSPSKKNFLEKVLEFFFLDFVPPPQIINGRPLRDKE